MNGQYKPRGVTVDERAQIVELSPQQVERGASQFLDAGILGIEALLFIIGVIYIVRWAFRKIDEAQTKQDALHTFYAEKLELKEGAHAAEIKRMHEEYANRMETTCEKFTESVDRIGKAVTDLQNEIRIIANQRGWDGTERRHLQ
jgi:hypothetical protein